MNQKLVSNLTTFDQAQSIVQQNYSEAMDDRVYFHQYRRPRPTNPTYSSSNVQNSMTFFNGGYYPDTKAPKEPDRRYTIETNARVPSAPRQMVQEHPKQLYPTISGGEGSRSGEGDSKLSKYGQRSLQLDQRGVCQKQSSPYNIVNLKPKEYNSEIRQYPWFSIENRDDVYYRRMNQQYQEKDMYSSRSRTFQKPVPSATIAGKQTYDLEPKLSLNPERRGNFTAKMLNHMDELQHNLA